MDPEIISRAGGHGSDSAPVSCEEVCSNDEADEVDDNYNTDDEVEVNKLRCKDEQSIRVKFCPNKAVVFAHIRKNGVT